MTLLPPPFNEEMLNKKNIGLPSIPILEHDLESGCIILDLS
jgi:hypothetical protein